MSELRHDWSKTEITTLFDLPFNDLLFQAQSIHRQHFDPNQVQVSTLLSIKTGACPEDCGYCSQSAKNDAEVERERLLPLDEVIEKANNTPFGLSAGVWTEKGAKIFHLTQKLNAGVVWANTFNKFVASSPFGGYKESGFGREGGLHGLKPYVKFD